MKGSTKRFPDTPKRKPFTRKRAERAGGTGPVFVPPALTEANLVAELVKAKESHLSDLRVLLDQGAAREKQLLELLEGKHYRPTVASGAPRSQPAPAAPAAGHLEALSDVAAFDEKEDAAQIGKQAEREKDLEREFQELSREEDEYKREHSPQGTE